MADDIDLGAILDKYSPLEQLPPESTGVKTAVYGPIVGEYHHDAMFGPKGNALGPNDVALSPDLLEKHPLGSTIFARGKEYTVADASYISPGKPNTNTIEFRDTKDPPETVDISPTATPEALPQPSPNIQQAISDVPDQALLAGDVTQAGLQSADVDLGAVLSKYASPTPAPSPTPEAIPEVDLGAVLSKYTSPSELGPAPEIQTGEPTELQKIGRAVAHYGQSMIPPTPTGLGEAVKQGVLQAAYQAIPGGLTIPETQHVLQRVGQIQAAEQTAPFSQERHDAAIATALDLTQAALGAKGAASALRSQIGSVQGQLETTARRVGAEPEEISIQPTTEPTVQQITSPQVTVSRFANRFMPEQPGGIGISTHDLVDQGTKMTPDQIDQHISNVVHDVPGDIVEQAAALRANEARLSERSARLSRKAMDNPSDVETQIAAQNALNDWMDFKSGPVAKIKTQWSNAGRAMQGEVPVDLSTLNGQIQAWVNDVGSAPPPEAIPALTNLAKDITKAADNRVKVADQWRAEASNWKTVVTDEMAEAQIKELLKKLTPC